MIKVGWSVASNRVQGPEVSAGTWGQISVKRLADELQNCREISAHEKITAFVFDFERGLIQYKVEPNLRS